RPDDTGQPRHPSASSTSASRASYKCLAAVDFSRRQIGAHDGRSLMKTRIRYVPFALLIAAGLGTGEATACNGACWQEVKLSPISLDGTKPVFGESRASSAE